MLEVPYSYPWWRIPILLVIFPYFWWKSTIFTMVSPWWNTHHHLQAHPAWASSTWLQMICIDIMILHVYCMLYELYIYILHYISILHIYIYICIFLYIYIFIVQLLTMAQMAIGAFRRCIPELHIAWTMYPLVSSGWWLSHLRKQGSQLGTSYPNNISDDDICLTGIGPKNL